MTEHVLECRWESQRCICEELRACEQRVSEETEHTMMEFFHWKPSPPHDKHYFADNICAYCVGRREGLDAAREAASNTRGWFTDEYPESDGTAKPVALIEDVVNRIDALKENP